MLVLRAEIAKKKDGSEVRSNERNRDSFGSSTVCNNSGGGRGSSSSRRYSHRRQSTAGVETSVKESSISTNILTVIVEFNDFVQAIVEILK